MDMLHLMKQFQASFTGDAGNYSQGTIELLTQTSQSSFMFQGSTSNYDESDIRLKKHQEVLKYFDNWTKLVGEDWSLQSASEKEKSLISRQTREDLAFLIIGFDTVCKSRITRNSNSMKPCYVNSDAIETYFAKLEVFTMGWTLTPLIHNIQRLWTALFWDNTQFQEKQTQEGKHNMLPSL